MFDDTTLVANRTGRLTPRQYVQLGANVLVSVGLMTLVGGVLLIAGVIQFANHQLGGGVVMLLMILVGAGIVARAGQKAWQYAHDLRRGVQVAMGRVSCNMASQAGRYDIRGYRLSGRSYVLRVRQSPQNAIYLDTDQALYKAIGQNESSQVYRVYYLATTRQVLSMEVAY